MNVHEFEQTLPILPDGHEWRVSTFMVDTFKFGWELQIVHVEKGGWFGLFDKHTRVVSFLVTAYTDELPEKDLYEQAIVMRNNLKIFLDMKKRA